MNFQPHLGADAAVPSRNPKPWICRRGSNLLVAAGSQVYVHSLQTAQRIRQIACPSGSIDVSARLSIEGRRDSRLVFTGTTDQGAVLGSAVFMAEHRPPVEQ